MSISLTVDVLKEAGVDAPTLAMFEGICGWGFKGADQRDNTTLMRLTAARNADLERRRGVGAETEKALACLSRKKKAEIAAIRRKYKILSKPILEKKKAVDEDSKALYLADVRSSFAAEGVADDLRKAFPRANEDSPQHHNMLQIRRKLVSRQDFINQRTENDWSLGKRKRGLTS